MLTVVQKSCNFDLNHKIPFMLLLRINKESELSIPKQLTGQLMKLINREALKEGDKLPSTRKLAAQLGINRTTVCKAYEELWAMGYIESNQGSYSYVRKPMISTIDHIAAERGLINWHNYINEEVAYLSKRISGYQKEVRRGMIDFQSLSPDPDLIPAEELRKSMNHALSKAGNNAFSYGNPTGYPPLRDTLANMMQKHGINASSDEILITSGTQNSLDILLKALTKPGSKVVVENPSYKWAINIFRMHGVEIITVPQSNEGIDLVQLNEIIQSNNVSFVYVMSNFQNPTGISLSQEKREQLLEMCESFGIPILEDGFEEEMKYFSKAILPLKAIDKNKMVIYMGTFSKVLAPGMRIGWIMADHKLMDFLSTVKATADLGSNTPNQMALEYFIHSGNYEKHLFRMHKAYRKRMHTALKAFRENLSNPNVEYLKPFGGYTIWVKYKAKNLSEAELLQRLYQKGVVVTPGSQYYENLVPEISFRISIAHAKVQEIEKGLKIIAETLNSI